MPSGISPEDVRHELDAYYRACDAVYGLARANRPTFPVDPTDLELLRLRTYARASKGFQARRKLAYDGYGVQTALDGQGSS